MKLIQRRMKESEMVDLESDRKPPKKKSSSTGTVSKSSGRKKVAASTEAATKSAGTSLRYVPGAGQPRNGHRSAKVSADVRAADPAPEVRPVEAATQTSGKPLLEDERRRLIAEAAYRRAERRGFRGGSPHNDWVEAEAEIDALLLETAASTRS